MAEVIAEQRQFLVAIDRLYAATLDPNKWPEFLAAVAPLFDADNVFVDQRHALWKSISYFGLNQSNRDRFPVSKFDVLMKDDPRMQTLFSEIGSPRHCAMTISRERLRSSRVYREYLKPLAIEYTMVVILPIDTDLTHHIGLTRGPQRRPFDESDCELLNQFVPHIARSIEIRRIINGNKKMPVTNAPILISPDMETDDVVLRRELGLSPSQARLTALLLAGRSIREISAVLGITEGSARQYLTNIFDKTGVRRQADLVRIAMTALTQRN